MKKTNLIALAISPLAALAASGAFGLETKDAGPTALELKEAVAGVNVAFEALKAANDEALALKLDGKAVDALIEIKLQTINEEVSQHQATLDAHILATKRRSSTMVDEHGKEIDLDRKADIWIKSATGDKSRTATGAQVNEYKEAFERYMRAGDKVMVGDEAKALSVGTDSDGGYQVHPDMSGSVVTRVFETSAMRAYAAAQTIGTDALEGSLDDDEAEAEWVGETEDRSETDTPKIGTWRIPVHELSAKPKATQRILDDASIDMERWLGDKVAQRFMRKENTAFVVGTGVNQPRGFLTYDAWDSAGEYQRNAMERFLTTVDGDFAADPGGADVLIKMTTALLSNYRANANWFMNRATTEKVRLLKNSDGDHMWQPSIQAGQPASLLGYSQAAFEDMPDPAAGSLSIAFGDMRQTYQIVDRMGIRLLRDPYTKQPYIMFISTKRVGGDVINFESMKLLEMSA